MEASPGLEAFIDEGIRLCRENDYPPKVFERMRRRHRTIGAITRLVVSGGEPQSGFKRMNDLGLLDWTIEAAVVRFPDEFSKAVREVAEWRLSQARAGGRSA
jgi:hypothetical protein